MENGSRGGFSLAGELGAPDLPVKTAQARRDMDEKF
jgi:hypothetical protein